MYALLVSGMQNLQKTNIFQSNMNFQIHFKLKLIVNVLIFVLLNARSTVSQRTSVLENTGKQIAKSLNYSVNPCTDFYEFACGNWKSTQNISQHVDSYDYYEIFRNKIADNVKVMLEDTANDSIEALFYRKCLDKDRINHLGHWPLAKILFEASGHHWPIVYPQNVPKHLPNWQYFSGNLFLLDANPLFSISFYANPNDNHRSQILIEPPEYDISTLTNPAAILEMASLFASTQPGPQLINPIILQQRIVEMIVFDIQLDSIKSNPHNTESAKLSLLALEFETHFQLDWTALLNDIFRRSMQQFSFLVNGFDNENSMNDAQLIGKSMEILKMAFQLAQKQNMPKSDVNYDKLSKLSKMLDHSQLELIKHWISNDNVISQLLYSFFNSPMFSRFDIVFANDLNYFRKLSKLLNATPKHILINYMGLKAILAYRNYIGGKTWDILHQTDPLPPKPLWKHCVNRVLKIYPWNVSHRYAKRHVPKEVKDTAMHLMRHSKFMFEKLVHSANWLDNFTRQRAIEKLRSARCFIAYPDWLLNEHEFGQLAKVNVQDKGIEFFALAVQKLTFNRAWQFVVLKLTSLNDFHGWSDAPIIVNAYNAPMTNSITIPFAILQPPFFHANYPATLNYGGILHILSHELIHSFDTTGSLFDPMGNMADWWHPLARNQFDSRAMCFARQYNQIMDPVLEMKINGYKTIGENIADNGAIRVAYKAFKMHRFLPSRIPHLEQFTSDQIFFLQYAQTFCGYFSPKQLLVQLLVDIHSPEKYRVNVPLSNFEPFARAFQCPSWSKMNNQYKCTIW